MGPKDGPVSHSASVSRETCAAIGNCVTSVETQPIAQPRTCAACVRVSSKTSEGHTQKGPRQWPRPHRLTQSQSSTSSTPHVMAVLCVGHRIAPLWPLCSPLWRPLILWHLFSSMQPITRPMISTPLWVSGCAASMVTSPTCWLGWPPTCRLGAKGQGLSPTP